MTHHVTIDRLGDLLDGALSANDTAEVEQHVKTCASCARDLGRLRSLVSAASDLPRAVEPPAALWPSIRETLETRKLATLHVAPVSTRRWQWFRNPWVVAASVLVLGTTAIPLVIRSAGDRSERRPVTAYSVSSRNASVVALMIERRYMPALNQLATTLRGGPGQTPRKTIPAVDRSLVIVDSAIAETRAALERDPGNRDIADLLAANYQKKLDLLKRATELVGEQ